MVNYSADLDATFAALADPTRRAILARLTLGEASVSQLAGPFSMSLPGVLKHVDLLARAGLLEARKDGRVRRCRLDAAPLSEAAEWIDRYRRFWEERLGALDRYLRETAKKEHDTWAPTIPRRPGSSGSRTASRRRGRESSGPGSSRKR
jgi:DNA-binding transcriptional ArsR family regulator